MKVFQGEREMAADNRLLGQFNLEGIPPSPRGVPQIEVSFDIDANGILNVSAKDLGTNKQQTVRIEQTAGLSDKDIEKMRDEAQKHADEDKQKRELAELRNQADNMTWQMEKLIKEHEAKLSQADKDAVTAAIKKTREAAKSDNRETIKAALSELEHASHALSRTLYQHAGPGAGPQAGPGAPPPGAGPTQGKPGGEDEAIDAEFEVKE